MSDVELVERIHKEFFNAGEECLKEAIAIINGSDVSIVSKEARLSKLGFVNNPLSESAKILKEKLVINKEIAAEIQSVSRLFPTYKYITRERVTHICKKYGLVKGGVKHYLGEIPEKNLQEIEKFSERYSIQRFKVDHIQYSYNSDKDTYARKIETFLAPRNGMVAYDRLSAQKILERCIGSPSIERLGGTMENALEICAPEKDMKKNFRTLFKITHEVKDPVVLMPYESGYIIVSAWGAEAKDEYVLNEKLN